jgi:hypothetical protein
MGTFGAPQAAPIADDVTTNGTAEQTQGEVQPTLDINDPAFTSEALDVNLEGDAYARPAPPPDGTYRAKLKLAQPKNAAGQPVDFLPGVWAPKKPQHVLYTGVRADIIDHTGKYDGIPVFDQSMSTFIQRDGSTKIQTLLAKLKRPSGEPYIKSGMRLTARGWMDLLLEALKTEPEVGIVTQWGWSCPACAEDAEKKNTRKPRETLGMAKFPPKKDSSGRLIPGVHEPEMKCAVNAAHGYNGAQLRIAAFVSVAELKS